MQQILSEKERNQLDQLVQEAEEQVKAQIVLAVVKRSDNYAEIPWKAFAFSASIAGLLVVVYFLLFPDWVSYAMILVSVGAILAAGAFFALLTVLFPGFARLFLSDKQAETETRQYAESLFINRELFATEGRTGILLLVSQFERQVVILPDKGLDKHLDPESMKRIIAKMVVHLRHREIKPAMESGLEELTRILETSASDRTVKNVLSNEIIEEEGI